MLAAFRQRYTASAPFTEDRALADDLTEQARPVFEALCDPTPEADSDPDHEAMALLTLLSRRAGLMGATPAASLGLCRGIELGLQIGGSTLSAAALEQLSQVILEGYVAGRDERVTADLRRAAVESLALLPLGQQAFALVVAGRFASEDLAPRLEEMERELLRTDARSLVLDVTRLVHLADDVPRLLCGVLATSQSLGVTAFVCGLDAHAQAPWREAGLADLGVEQIAAFDEALTKVFACVDLELKPRRRWPGPLFWRRASDRERDQS